MREALYAKGTSFHAMDLPQLLEEHVPGLSPAGLVGCRSMGNFSTSCIHDIVVFDDLKHLPQIITHNDGKVMLCHGSLSDGRPLVLAGYLGMSIIRDDTMILASFLRNIKTNHEKLFRDCARIYLANAMLCTHKSSIAVGDAVSCWQKCATLYLGDAVLALHSFAPSSHALSMLRSITGGTEYSAIPLVVETLEAKRASPTLLHRMMLSTQRLAEVAGTISPYVIRHKAQALIDDSRLADCYWYLCHTSRDCWIQVGGTAITERAISIAIDINRDITNVRNNAARIQEATDKLLVQIAEDALEMNN